MAAAEQRRIEATELVAVRRSQDGTRLVLVMRDADGANVSLSLPCACLNAVLASVPQQVDSGTVHQLDAWSLAPSDNGRDLVLTLRTY